MLSALMFTTTLLAAGFAVQTTASPVNSLNCPRTVVTIACRVLKPRREWEGSSAYSPRMSSTTVVAGSNVLSVMLEVSSWMNFQPLDGYNTHVPRTFPGPGVLQVTLGSLGRTTWSPDGG